MTSSNASDARYQTLFDSIDEGFCIIEFLGLNGRQVADAAQALRPQLKVLFITGYAENAALNHGHIGPGMAVLTKPFAISELVRRVERMLGRN